MTMPTGVQRRGGTYWLRVGIPDDLRHLYPRTSKGALATDRYRASLRTTDKDEAKAKALALRAEFEAEFIQKRKTLVSPAIRPAPPLQRYIAEAVYSAEMARDDANRKDKAKTVREFSGVHVGYEAGLPELPEVSRLDPLPANTLAIREVRRTQYLQHVRDALGTGNLRIMIPLATKAAKSLGVEVDWDSDEGAATLEACLKEYARAKENAIRKDQGHVIETPPAPKLPQDAQEGTQQPPGAPQTTQATQATPGTYRTIRDLLPLWMKKAKPTPEALGDVERALKLLDESGVAPELATLKGSHGAAFRDWLRDTEARGISQTTASTRFGAIKTLLNVGTEYDALPSNPWVGLRFQVTGARKRTPFTREELAAIHLSKQFSTYTPPGVGKGVAAVPYWMPFLGLFSGARLGELAQLEVADVRKHDGFDILDIHEEADGSTVKTENGVRRIPVHPELVRLGFLDYVRDLKAAGETKLFPTLHRPGEKTPGYIFGQAFRAYLDSVGVKRPLATFHAYRHGFRSALENVGVSTVRIHRLVGHADGSVDSRYTHLEMETMAADVAKVAFPFLPLPRVYPASAGR